jgi:hypothetical protein
MTPSQNGNTQKAVQDVIDTNQNLVDYSQLIPLGAADYDAVVYKLLRLALAVTSRLDSLYQANQQQVKRGQLLVANNTLADLFKCHVETDNLGE